MQGVESLVLQLG